MHDYLSKLVKTESKLGLFFREAQLVTLLSPFATLKQDANPLPQGVLSP
jgi:hypothetical protein